MCAARLAWGSLPSPTPEHRRFMSGYIAQLRRWRDAAYAGTQEAPLLRPSAQRTTPVAAVSPESAHWRTDGLLWRLLAPQRARPRMRRWSRWWGGGHAKDASAAAGAAAETSGANVKDERLSESGTGAPQAPGGSKGSVGVAVAATAAAQGARPGGARWEAFREARHPGHAPRIVVPVAPHAAGAMVREVWPCRARCGGLPWRNRPSGRVVRSGGAQLQRS